MNDSITCDTPESINMFRLLAIKNGLKFEIKTGISMNRNLFSAAKQLTGKKTRKACLEAVEKIIEEAKTS